MNDHAWSHNGIANPPALIAEVAPASWAITELAAYTNQQDAHDGCVMENLTRAVAVIKEIARNPELLANTQVTTELDSQLDFLDRNEPDATAGLRAALALMGPRPEPEIDPELVAMLAWIKREVAPRRTEESYQAIDMPTTRSVLGDVNALLALGEGGDGKVELADWVNPDA